MSITHTIKTFWEIINRLLDGTTVLHISDRVAAVLTNQLVRITDCWLGKNYRLREQIEDLLEERHYGPEEQVLIKDWSCDLDLEPEFFASLERWTSIFINLETVLHQMR